MMTADERARITKLERDLFHERADRLKAERQTQQLLEQMHTRIQELEAGRRERTAA